MSASNRGTVKYRYSAEHQRDVWQARWTRGDKTRTPWSVLPDSAHLPNTPEGEAAARKEALTFVPDARAATKDGKGETVSHYADRWLAQRAPKARRDNKSHLDTHVLKVIGDASILLLAHADGDRVVAYLDGEIAAGEMSAKHAKNIWATAKRMLKDAATAKPATGLRCLDVNPFRDVQPPNKSKTTQAKNWIYPDEFSRFVTCTKVPVKWRRNVAIAVFLGLRDGEQRALDWKHVDLDHGIVNVCETFDQIDKAVREGTKSGASRPVPIPAPLMPLLRQMRDEAGGKGRVCRGIASQRAMARGLRNWLKKAGVTRPALHDTTAVNLNLRWHDLRATCGTWLALLGKTGVEIRDVLGHTQTAMTDRYLRNATVGRGGMVGVPFPELPEMNRHSIVSRSDTHPEMTDRVISNIAISQANKRGGRDSNPRPPA